MSNPERNASARYGSVSSRAGAGEIDQGLRAYMLKVYNYMAMGLGLTGIAAYAAFSAAVTTDPSLAAAEARGGLMLTEFGVMLYTSPLKWVVMLAPLGLVFFLAARIQKMSVAAAQVTFLVYATLVGVSLSSIFLIFTGQSITQVFFITAASFAALSLFGYTTKRDLTGWGSFLFMGLIGLILASVVNIFLASSALAFAISAIGVVVFAGLTAYDTQKIKEMYFAGDDSTSMGRKAIMGALNLYLDFINMFIMLLQLVGDRR
ncbi:Bax inhibitor-1/YccA family protein [Methylobrevis pamukkalensis]|uniref:Inner membrane protein YbhL n=1 Tax=Methylobrevis pamukkalensis TaxID=1439726 RepID=A0A1E3H255_9HYPH|nr:Bax inhibitor-1/YccA family protein [Methylobrevis pamukkalensis]ODN70413.1 Inner membrane protein YbhL [Methylobrevis pamukkalensis]